MEQCLVAKDPTESMKKGYIFYTASPCPELLTLMFSKRCSELSAGDIQAVVATSLCKLT